MRISSDEVTQAINANIGTGIIWTPSSIISGSKSENSLYADIAKATLYCINTSVPILPNTAATTSSSDGFAQLSAAYLSLTDIIETYKKDLEQHMAIINGKIIPVLATWLVVDDKVHERNKRLLGVYGELTKAVGYDSLMGLHKAQQGKYADINAKSLKLMGALSQLFARLSTIDQSAIRQQISEVNEMTSAIAREKMNIVSRFIPTDVLILL